jgi:hypothetical protein
MMPATGSDGVLRRLERFRRALAETPADGIAVGLSVNFSALPRSLAATP